VKMRITWFFLRNINDVNNNSLIKKTVTLDDSIGHSTTDAELKND
jgi:hypothetical protein